MKRFSRLLLLFVFAAAVISCKKDVPNVSDEGKEFGIDKSKEYLADETESKLRDSVWIYYKFLSLWEDSILPEDYAKVNQRGFVRDNYTKYFETSENVLDFLMSKTPVRSATSKPIDRFSFIDRQGVVSGELSGGGVTDFGFSLFYLETENSSPNSADPYIRLVDGNSPAYRADLRRGDRILSVNGNSNIDWLTQRNQDWVFIENALNQSTITMRIQRGSSSPFEVVLQSVNYQENPVVGAKTINYGGKKVGYLPFGSFLALTANISAQGDLAKTLEQRFEEIFDDFESQGVTELVVDLRYNGGGYVSTAEYLVDKLAPSTANGKVMFTYKVNERVLNHRDFKGEFDPVKIEKSGTLNLNRIYFLVSPHTASASELLINTLKPYMNCVVIGTVTWDENGRQVNNNTYGKPVGFFGLPLMDDALELYVTSFEMVNSLGEGGYYEGLVPNLRVSEFSSFYDFGDVRESMLARALQHISPTAIGAAKLASTMTNGAMVLDKGKSFGRKSLTDAGMFKSGSKLSK